MSTFQLTYIPVKQLRNDENLSRFSNLLPTLMNDILKIDSTPEKNLIITFQITNFNQFYTSHYLIEILNLFLNYLNLLLDQQSIASLTLTLDKILNVQKFDMTKALIFLNLLKHYPKIIENYPAFYEYFNRLISLHHFQLLDFTSQTQEFPSSEKYWQNNSFELFPNFKQWYGIGDRLIKHFKRGKMTFFGEALLETLAEKINRVSPNIEEIWTYLPLTDKKVYDILKEEIGAIVRLNSFQAQTLNVKDALQAMDILNRNDPIDKEENNYVEKGGIILKIKYPVNSKLLSLTKDIKTVLSYPLSYYKLVNKFISGPIIICELECIMEGGREIFDVYAKYFDSDFLIVLKFLMDNIIRDNWLILYLYFLERKNEDLLALGNIIVKAELRGIFVDENFRLNGLNYFESFQAYIQNLANIKFNPNDYYSREEEQKARKNNQYREELRKQLYLIIQDFKKVHEIF